jgi:hypothetical protein
MCYAHVTMDLNKKLPGAKIYEAFCDEIKDDVSLLAEATFFLEFAAGLFSYLMTSLIFSLLAARTLEGHWKEKWGEVPKLWREDEDPKKEGALNKFFKSWLMRPAYRNWFYRYASCFVMPSMATDNGLEGTNKSIKDEYTERERLGLSKYILVCEQLVKNWSRDPERQVRVSRNSIIIFSI